MDTNKLLHPEKLSQIELVEVLKSLYVTIPPGLPKSEVLKIFYKVALPLPQRTEALKSCKCSTEETLNLNKLEISNSNFKRHDAPIIIDINNAKRTKLQNSVETNDLLQIKHKFQISNKTKPNLQYRTETFGENFKRPYIISQIEISDRKRIKLMH